MQFLAGHEHPVRGTFDFPVELYYVDQTHPRYEMPFHWHMEREIMLILSGHFTLPIDGSTHCLEAGDAAVIRTGVIHGCIPDNCIYECLVFDMDRFLGKSAVCKQKYAAFFGGGAQICPVFKAGSPVCKLLDQLFETMEKERPASSNQRHNNHFTLSFHLYGFSTLYPSQFLSKIVFYLYYSFIFMFHLYIIPSSNIYYS